MLRNWKPYIMGAAVMFVLLSGLYLFFIPPNAPLWHSSANSVQSTIPSDAVTITPLPTLRIIRGDKVAFEGQTELKQAIGGIFAQELTIVNFQATGENAEKSYIKIMWENGEIEKLYPGTANKKFAADRRASEITVVGYSVHERRIFKNSSRPGTLTWELRYDPVEK